MAKGGIPTPEENSEANESPPLKPQAGTLQQMGEVVITLLPSRMREIFERGLFNAFLRLTFYVVILPVFIVVLAAFWMSQLDKLDNGLAKSIRKEILQTFYDGFSVDNSRLDYFQVFEVDLSKANPSQGLRINIHRGQKASVEIKTVKYNANRPDCTLPEKDIQLVRISLNDQEIEVYKEGDQKVTSVIEQKWWKSYLDGPKSDNALEELLFSLTSHVRKLPCGQVHVSGSISVFKDILPVSTGLKR